MKSCKQVNEPRSLLEIMGQRPDEAAGQTIQINSKYLDQTSQSTVCSRVEITKTCKIAQLIHEIAKCRKRLASFNLLQERTNESDFSNASDNILKIQQQDQTLYLRSQIRKITQIINYKQRSANFLLIKVSFLQQKLRNYQCQNFTLKQQCAELEAGLRFFQDQLNNTKKNTDINENVELENFVLKLELEQAKRANDQRDTRLYHLQNQLARLRNRNQALLQKYMLVKLNQTSKFIEANESKKQNHQSAEDTQIPQASSRILTSLFEERFTKDQESTLPPNQTEKKDQL